MDGLPQATVSSLTMPLRKSRHLLPSTLSHLIIKTPSQEFETAAATSEEPYAAAARANTSRRRHPTLGCDIFSSPGRDSALRACGWGLRPEGVNEIVGGGISGGGGDIRGRDGGDARSGVNSRGELTSGDRHLRSVRFLFCFGLSAKRFSALLFVRELRSL